AVFHMKPRSHGAVRLTSPDPEAPLEIDHGFLSDPADVAPIVAGIERLRSLAASEPVARYVEREVRPGGGADLDTYVRANARGFFHPTATCAMGRVVEQRCRVLSIDNLVV